MNSLPQTRVDPINLAAVGRVAQIGELYDARTEQFLRMSLVNGNFSTLIQSTDNRHSNIKYLKLNTLSEKLTSLDVQAGFKLSVLFGLVQVSGSGKYVRDTQHSSKSVKVSVATFITTEFEQIDIAGIDGRRLIDLDILAKIDATHVVVGIQWGGNVIISVEDSNSESRDKETVVGSLAGKLELALASISVDGSVAIDDEQRKELSQFSFELYGDILPDHIPITVVDAMVLMRNVTKMLMEGNNGKGKALSYTLLPIALFRELLSLETGINSLVAFLDTSTIDSCVKLFEELSSVELKISDLKKELNIFQNYISKDKVDKINAFDNSFQLNHYDLKRNLAEHLILVRSGKESVNSLMKVIEDAYSHDLSPNKIDFDQFLPIQAGFRFVELLFELSANVLDRMTTFNHFMSMNLNKNIYAFFYSEEFPHLSDESMIAFRQFLSMGEAFDPIGIFVAIKVDVLGDIERQTYFNFDASNILRLYNNGILVIDNYKLSSNTNPTNVPEIWSLSYMQTQLANLINNSGNSFMLLTRLTFVDAFLLQFQCITFTYNILICLLLKRYGR